MRLREAERQDLAEAARALVGPKSIAAVCAYGSKVAGYARPDSDYDILVVARRFGEGVRYKYVKEPVETSALIVDEDMLRQDARTGYLGEFVVGRLLNFYEPIEGEQLLREVEVEYKKRVIVEALFELSTDYGDFSRHITAPYDYFLFEKLRKRAVVYPPALYSYVQTYTCSRSRENLTFSTNGFKEAATSLASRGFLHADAGGVKVHPEKMKGDAFTKVLSLFSLTARGITQYAVHGYAGRVGLGVFRREALSKFRRLRERPEPPTELERPKSLLKLDEGQFVPEAAKINDQLAKLAGFADYAVSERILGEPYTTTRVVTIRGGSRERSFVVKNFSDVRSLKWAILGVWAVTARKFSMTPMARLEREYQSSITLREKGVLTPMIVAVAPDERVIVKDFVEGPPLSRVIEGLMSGARDGLGRIAKYGDVLAKVHRAGLALGDAKASNVVVARDGLYLTDLEQAVLGGDAAWDLAEFLYYTAKLSLKEDKMKEVAETFLEAYVSSAGREAVERARGNRYLAPFRPFLTPGMASMLRGVMAEFS
ncbi:MAG: nucleotidyltransferase domain-containing protein [Nitrososphaerales archaeon]|nr:nucleotidyltransferase domain-containing protein [Nitrososphaerales archaeon]